MIQTEPEQDKCSGKERRGTEMKKRIVAQSPPGAIPRVLADRAGEVEDYGSGRAA